MRAARPPGRRAPAGVPWAPGGAAVAALGGRCHSEGTFSPICPRGHTPGIQLCATAISTTSRREYVITRPDTPAAVDQLPGQRGLLRDHLEHGRRLFLLPRRPAAPTNPVPLQQRRRSTQAGVTCTCATTAPASYWSPVVAADAARSSSTTNAATACATPITLRRTGDTRRDAVLRAARRDARGLARCGSRTSAPTPAEMSLFRSVEFCLWDALDDATNFQRNYSIGEVEVARRRDLPHDRVPGTAGSFRLLRLLRAAGRVRHPARGVPRRLPRLGPARWRSSAGSRPARSRTAGRRTAVTTSGSPSRPARPGR